MTYVLSFHPEEKDAEWLVHLLKKTAVDFGVDLTYEGLAPFAKKCATRSKTKVKVEEIPVVEGGNAVMAAVDETHGSEAADTARQEDRQRVVAANNDFTVAVALRSIAGDDVTSKIGPVVKDVEIKEEIPQSEDGDAVTDTPLGHAIPPFQLIPGYAVLQEVPQTADPYPFPTYEHQDFPDFDDRDAAAGDNLGEIGGNEDGENVEVKEELVTDFPFALRDPTMPIEMHDLVSEDGGSQGTEVKAYGKAEKNTRRHYRSYTGEEPFKCGICKKMFTGVKALRQHQRRHTGGQPYECGTCKKRFYYAHDLKRHQMVHTGERPYACDVCDYKASRRGRLKIHQRIHTGEKPYACTICGYKTGDSSHFSRHMQRHSH